MTNRPPFAIGTQDMVGWLRVFLGSGEPTGELAVFLSDTLQNWFRQRPHLRLQFIMPITSNGDTSELHAWFDQVQFPDHSPLAPRRNG